MTKRGPKPPSEHLALDTSAYSHLRRRHPLLLDWLAAARLIDVCVTVVGELQAGFRLGSRYEENASTLAEFLAEPFVQVQPCTLRVAHRYGQLFADLRRAGTPLPLNNIWIAASAIESGAHLVTFDSDFARIVGLSHSILS